MKISLERSQYHRFALYYSYDPERVSFCQSLKESFGWENFSFSSQGSQKRWVFSDSLLIPIIEERFPETEVEPGARSIVVTEQAWARAQGEKNQEIDSIKIKLDTTFHIKGIKGEMYPYQKVGTEFLVASGGRAIIADAMGLGKSLQALAYIKHSGHKRTLVVCPASVKFAWEVEIKKWTNLSSVIIDSKTKFSEIDSSVNLWIVNYDILRKHFEELSKTRFDVIIGDECTYIKSLSAQRSKAFRAISRNIPSVIFLSGTPLLSRPSELFSLLNIIDPGSWANWYEFARKYCAMKRTRWGMDTSGASNTEELHSKIRRYFIRRDKTEVLTELPPKNFMDIPVSLDKEYQKEYNDAAQDFATYLRGNTNKDDDEIAKSLQAEKLIQINTLRQLNAMGKVGSATEIIQNITDAGEKVLVFCSFVKPLEALKEHFGDKAVIITGKTPVEERKDIIGAFQNQKEVQIFLGGYKSAGMGVTLTAASNFLGLDFPWNPADLSQSIDRLHRPGQVANSVNIYQLIARDTIDEDMKGVLEYKQDIFDQIIEGKLVQKVGKDAIEAAVQGVLRNY
jgi:SWI/SNF-related matrix-associated actin-dependent regulator 1 of chromatin subfamily A